MGCEHGQDPLQHAHGAYGLGSMSVSFSPDGQTLATWELGQDGSFMGCEHGQDPLRTLTGHTRWVNSVSFSPDGQTLASGSSDKTVRSVGCEHGQDPLRTLTGHTDEVE